MHLEKEKADVGPMTFHLKRKGLETFSSLFIYTDNKIFVNIANWLS